MPGWRSKRKKKKQSRRSGGRFCRHAAGLLLGALPAMQSAAALRRPRRPVSADRSVKMRASGNRLGRQQSAPDFVGPLGDSVLNAGRRKGRAGIVGGLKEAEPRREHHGLVQTQSPQNLAGHQVAAGIAGDHNGVQVFVIQGLLQKAGWSSVDQGHDVGAGGVVVVGAEQSTASL